MLTTRHTLALLGLGLGFTACDSTTPRDPADSDPPVSAAVQAAAVGPYYVPTTLGTVPGRARAINNQGQVIGIASGAFIWRNGVFRNLGSLGGGSTIPNALNEAGQVVGESYTSAGDAHAFLWENGVMRDLGTLGAPFVSGQVLSSATGINAAGQIVGWAPTSDDLIGSRRAFLWENGRMTRLASLNRVSSLATGIDNLGRVVGEFGASNPKAFRWVAGVVRSLGTLGGPTSSASAISAGRIVGSSLNASGQLRGFLWQSGVMTNLGTLGGDLSTAAGINTLGQIVGSSRIPGSNTIYAYVWENGVMTNVGAGEAYGINRNGWIAGARPNPRVTRNLNMLPTVWKPSATPPVTPSASILVGRNFFYSEHNGSVQATVDTVAVGTTVTWEWLNASGHNVQSVGSPGFASSPIINTPAAKYRVTFTRPGTHQYNCVIHPGTMTGRVVVR
ncbi:MAG TPA: plastocyanin/azurin family copper-binding protein [Gemmatimonadales bacterium]